MKQAEVKFSYKVAFENKVNFNNSIQYFFIVTFYRTSFIKSKSPLF